MRHCAEFCADQSNSCGDMIVCRFFKMAAVRHLDFETFEILTDITVRRADVGYLSNLLPFLTVQYGGRPPSWTFKSSKF